MPPPIPAVRYVPPSFANPYPGRVWSTITAFSYDTDLELTRSIEAVQVRKGEDAEYVVSEDYKVSFALDAERRTIVVPRGMLTDLSSVPRITRPIIDRVGPHLEASIVHDFLYVAWQDIPGHGARDDDRRFADELFKVAMAEAEVHSVKRWLIYQAVAAFGGSAYRETDEQRYIDLG